MSKQATAGTSGSSAADELERRAATSAGGAARGRRAPRAAARRARRSATGATNSVPPWTMRWPTASIGPARSSSVASASSSTCPRGARRLRREEEPVVRRRGRASLRLLEPALTTRMRIHGLGVGPGPVADLGRILAVCAGVGAAAEPLVDHSLPQLGRVRAEARDAVDHVDHEVEAVEVVEHDHVERRRRRPLLLVAAHVDVLVVRAPVGEAVDQPRVAVVGEDDRPVGREDRVELAVGEPVRVLAVGLRAASGRRR